MPRDNGWTTIPNGWYIDEAAEIPDSTLRTSGDIADEYASSRNITFRTGYSSFMLPAPNPLTKMFAEKRAKKNGHKSVDKLLLELKAFDEQNSGLRRELNTKTKENEEMKARILYLEEAILELEGK